ncbi:IclR family transcriptional regulator [Streptomyces sp. DH41]|uniref:IclR family transcriptional regulator n=1 Tax=Streptomyces sp. DH41 TaxID=3040125 RepID=UPI002441C2D5|nr:helix-turn-helix domain-containing protein [Streptomyces sp. DH41]MDG9722870.1 helix-turn-helix domain-containing protein [Streptomyces sp. DH41]
MTSVRDNGIDTGVGVLDKAMAIVAVCEHRPSSAARIAQELSMTTSTTHRLAGALTAHGLLHRDDAGLYRPGPRLQPRRLTALARPCLDRLTKELDETSQLWVPSGTDRVCAVSTVPHTELRVVFDAGLRLPLTEGGSAAHALRGLTGPDGWVESVSTRTPGLGSVSAPVREGEDIVAAVCVVAPLFRMPGSPGHAYGARVAASAAEITRLLAG